MKLSFASLGILLISAVLFCGFACNSTTVHKVNQSNKEISDLISQLETSSESLYSQHVIDSNDAATIGTFVLEATADHQVLTGQLRAFNNQPATVDQVLVFVQQFADKVHGLDLHLKSTQAQEAATVFFSAFDAAITTLRATLQAVKTGSIAHQEPMRAGLDPAQEIALGLDAFASIGRLIAEWLANGKLTDQQLQDAADAEDDETKKATLAFLKTLGK